jgi:hypothetical protein
MISYWCRALSFDCLQLQKPIILRSLGVICHMRVSHAGDYVVVAEDVLNCQQIAAILDHQGRKRMAKQHMRTTSSSTSSFFIVDLISQTHKSYNSIILSELAGYPKVPQDCVICCKKLYMLEEDIF